MLVEGLACVFHGERVAGVLAWARGARVRVVGPPSCALRTGLRQAQGRTGVGSGVAVGLRGEGDAAAQRPCPGFPLSRERRWGWAGPEVVPVGVGAHPWINGNLTSCTGRWFVAKIASW